MLRYIIALIYIWTCQLYHKAIGYKIWFINVKPYNINVLLLDKDVKWPRFKIS